MHTYEVRPGDSPASIAIAHAGCPKCSHLLIAANSHKSSRTLPNGYKTFKELRVGEKLNLPHAWFDGSLDKKSRAYFDALPHPDGITRSHKDVSGALGDPMSDAVSALAQLDDHTFSYGVTPACLLIDQSVSAANGSSNPGIAAYASATHIGTNAARQRNQDLIRAMSAGDKAAASAARLDIQNDLLTAVASAQLAVNATGGAPPDAGSVVVDIGQATIEPTIRAVAQAAATAIGADPNFCASVAQPGNPVNAAVHAFKMAWNAANPGNQVPVGTGTYDQATADVLKRTLGAAPAACGTHAPSPPSIPLPGITPPQAQAQSSGLSTGAIVGLGLVGVSAVGGALYLVTRHPSSRGVRRVPA